LWVTAAPALCGAGTVSLKPRSSLARTSQLVAFVRLLTRTSSFSTLITKGALAGKPVAPLTGMARSSASMLPLSDVDGLVSARYAG
jgi:hypothetical protein